MKRLFSRLFKHEEPDDAEIGRRIRRKLKRPQMKTGQFRIPTLLVFIIFGVIVWSFFKYPFWVGLSLIGATTVGCIVDYFLSRYFCYRDSGSYKKTVEEISGLIEEVAPDETIDYERIEDWQDDDIGRFMALYEEYEDAVRKEKLARDDSDEDDTLSFTQFLKDSNADGEVAEILNRVALRSIKRSDKEKEATRRAVDKVKGMFAHETIDVNNPEVMRMANLNRTLNERAKTLQRSVRKREEGQQ